MRSRFLARWVALTAACLSLVGSAAPTWELPRAGAPVAAMVVGASARPVRAATSPRVEAPRRPHAFPRTVTAPERPTPRAGSRPLFVLHRALLR